LSATLFISTFDRWNEQINLANLWWDNVQQNCEGSMVKTPKIIKNVN
jgi:hypothetical protein